MNEFLDGKCPHCGQGIDYPSELTGQLLSCPVCEKPIKLTPASLACKSVPTVIPPEPGAAKTKSREQRLGRTSLSKLTEETIKARTKAGDTPLHRAAKNGQFEKIPAHLLNAALLMAQNNGNETPLHFAAKYGHLDQIPPEFLTKETLTVLDHYGRTPLHVAAECGHADQILREFLTPEFLSISTKNFTSNTILHILAARNELAKIPPECITHEMWHVENGYGHTPRGLLEAKLHENDWRNDPATEKQKEKLRWFGCTWDEGITKGQASDALDQCAGQFPQRDAEWYGRPASPEQIEQLDAYGVEIEKGLTYADAKELIEEYEPDETPEQEYIEYLCSDEGMIDAFWELINEDFGDEYRAVTREEVDKAWVLVKSRKSELPTPFELVDALQKLYSDFRKR